MLGRWPPQILFASLQNIFGEQRIKQKVHRLIFPSVSTLRHLFVYQKHKRYSKIDRDFRFIKVKTATKNGDPEIVESN